MNRPGAKIMRQIRGVFYFWWGGGGTLSPRQVGPFRDEILATCLCGERPRTDICAHEPPE